MEKFLMISMMIIAITYLVWFMIHLIRTRQRPIKIGDKVRLTEKVSYQMCFPVSMEFVVIDILTEHVDYPIAVSCVDIMGRDWVEFFRVSELILIK